MASSLRLPAGSFARSARSSSLISQTFAPASHQYRFFSQASQRWAYKSNNFSAKNVTGPSMKTRSKEALGGQLPNDIGVLPGTFVRPLWRDMPSIFQSPRDRWEMEWTWIKSKVTDFFRKDNKFPLLLKERRKIARLLYGDMYTAFARGDTSGLRRLCCDGLSKNLIMQIDSRPKNQQVTWNLVKWLRGPSTYFTGIRIVSDRATQIPDMNNSGIRQIVVRLTSRQSMSKTAPQPRGKGSVAEIVEAPAKEQNCEEYFVIQELHWHGKSNGWRAWGYVKPTDIDTVYSDPYFAPGLTPLERIDGLKKTSDQ
ncbi:uncharacterized protein N7484_007632 [Penicillium longicatenatum]|uniref:uncharacterized protein n=1 Tax=Penicillium longicatenatum TaxID=1561947 RepID=UPI00254988F4|nr:uncharacterized protein N7484_007632 [Penicillium longicatenatum]KAJ5639770.1 hypothetical protein N7484_007632 [Penicillium longicatenatum]